MNSFEFSPSAMAGISRGYITKNSDGNNYKINSTTYGKPDVFSLANAFLSISSMTHKKLQKLCYYAKAWYLAIFDENLIQEPFEAWVHGAVQPSLYRVYKDYGYDKIPQLVSVAGIPEEFLSFAHEVYKSYGDLTGSELEALNHSEDPWIKARTGLKPWERGCNIISEEDMKEYYRKMINA